MICRKCGYSNPNNANRCAQCGEILYTPTVMRNKRQKKEKIIVVLILIIVFLLLVAGVVFIYKHSGSGIKTSNPGNSFVNTEDFANHNKENTDGKELDQYSRNENENMSGNVNAEADTTVEKAPDTASDDTSEVVVMCGFCQSGDHIEHPVSNKTLIYGDKNIAVNVSELNGVIYIPFSKMIEAVDLICEETEVQGVFGVYQKQIMMGTEHKANLVAVFDMNDCHVEKDGKITPVDNVPIEYEDEMYVDINVFGNLNFDVAFENDSVIISKQKIQQQEPDPQQIQKPDPQKCGYCGTSAHTTYNHPKCTICGATDHVKSGHPKCTICGATDHLEGGHPKCTICGATDHLESGHPRCPVCNDITHTVHCTICNQFSHNTDGHPKCPVCGDINHLIHCSICDSRDHSDDGHPRCSECGSPDHIVHIFIDKDF